MQGRLEVRYRIADYAEKFPIKTAERTEIYFNIYKYKLSLIREEKDIWVVYQRDIIWQFIN
jgi:hypothetical protein